MYLQESEVTQTGGKINLDHCGPKRHRTQIQPQNNSTETITALHN